MIAALTIFDFGDGLVSIEPRRGDTRLDESLFDQLNQLDLLNLFNKFNLFNPFELFNLFDLFGLFDLFEVFN